MSLSRVLTATVVTLAVILLAGCGGATNTAAPAVQPHLVDTRLPANPGPTVRPANGIPQLGDLDEDGNPGVGDAIKILRIVVALDTDVPQADANQNGSTDVGDAIKLLRLVVGLDTDWPLTWTIAWVDGKVREFVDDQTTPPLEGAAVTVGGHSDTSDSNGDFHITAVPLGNQSISVTKSGYEVGGSLPATVSVQPPTTDLAPVYMIGSGSTPPPAP